MKVVRKLARKKQEDPPKGSPAWMATFSDLMNLLLCFFVLLFAMSNISEEKFREIAASLSSAFSILNGGESAIGEGQLISMGTSQLNDLDEYYSNMGQSSEETGESIKNFQEAIENQKQQEMENIYDTLSELTSRYNMDQELELEMDEEGKNYVMLTMNGQLLFESGRAELTEKGLPILSKVGDILKYFDNNRIAIIGYTDNVKISSGRYKNIRYLSAARAIETAEYLIQEKGFDPARIEYTGRGEQDPIADNSTEAGRAKNRRVEIRIYNMIGSN